MPYPPEEFRPQLEEGERPPESLQNLKKWLTDKGIPEEHASLTGRLIKGFYSRYPLPTIGDSAYIGFGEKPTEFGGLYLWVYNFWPTARGNANTEELEQINALTIPFSKEISRPLRPHISVRPKFLAFCDPSVIDSFEEVLLKGCKKRGIDYIGAYRIMNNKGRISLTSLSS